MASRVSVEPLVLESLSMASQGYRKKPGDSTNEGTVCQLWSTTSNIVLRTRQAQKADAPYAR
ncbi:MAG: hypothetical protein A3H91_12345 [Gammaproteobacteria bacterium RIFCSPLOWO2_02_FULL_61_13]|nr:MAG: hypothetical protein A3H91_12345 [Gammaproteobacteria bacterium RIFCSPLOWO2_02_FULL_61_13]